MKIESRENKEFRIVNTKSNAFLAKFKIFEKEIKKLAGVKSDYTQQKDIIRFAKKKNPLIGYKEDLISDLYALRNVVAHIDREKYIADINEYAFNELNKFIQLLEKPPKAIDVFNAEIFKCSTTDISDSVLRKMKERLYTHIPVYDNGKFIGVLSESTILEWLVENIEAGKVNFHKKTIGDINRKYLNNKIDLYKFAPSNKSVFEIQKMFDEAIENKKRLGVVFITENGKSTGEILGLVTAWDLPKIRDYLK